MCPHWQSTTGKSRKQLFNFPRKTKVSAVSAKKLSAALPQCKIERDGGAIEPGKK